MRFVLFNLFFLFLLKLVSGQCDGFSHPNTYNVPLLDFTCNPAPKSALSTTSKCPIALTFDDGPLGQSGDATDQIINYLHAQNLTATFFMNTVNFCDVNTDIDAQNQVRSIVNKGFSLASHTAHHSDLTTLTSTQIKAEIDEVQTTVNNLFGGASKAPQLTLFRAPYD
jgi:peptidoglycan/xylan/chitin deacetylase (PgdA/CDA1 family)